MRFSGLLRRRIRFTPFGPDIVVTTPRVLVVGRFPPPLDGQSILTRRLARLLESDCDVRRIDVSTGESALAESSVRLRTGRLSHYVAFRKRLRSTMKGVPETVVLWPGVSGSTLGHFRDLSVVLASLPRDTRLFAVVHWGNFHELFERLSTRVTARLLVKRLTGIVFNDETLRNRAARWVPTEKQIVIPNTIDESVHLTEAELTSKRTARRERLTFRMLYLGSMTPSKGWEDVVKAVQFLSSTGVAVRLDIVGRWESEQQHAAFSDYILRHNLNESISHLGGVSDRAAIKELYSQADALVLPTYYPTEAQPLTVIEALSAGTPIITTRHAGLPGMLDDGVEGYFVPPRDPEAIAACVQQLMPFENWRSKSVAARSRFNRQFHPDLVRDLWTRLIAGNAGTAAASHGYAARVCGPPVSGPATARAGRVKPS